MISYPGLYGDNSIELVRNLINITQIEKKGHYYNWQIKPHIHSGLFQLFVIESGTVEILFADGSRHVQSPSYFTIPKNVLHGFRLQPGMTGWVISLNDSTLEDMLRQDAELFFAIDEIQIVKMNADDLLISDAYTTIHKCIAEYNSTLPGKNLGLQYLVGMLLLRLYRIPNSSRETIRASENTDKLYYRKFNQLMKGFNVLHKTIEDYAALLQISPGHLNRICRNVTGKSPKDITIDHFIHEAKIALINHSLSISEISYQLNFQDPGYFSRLFKKKTGQTPREFRLLNSKNQVS